MDPKLICLVLCAVLALSDSAYVDTINKCSFKSDECVTKAIQQVLSDIGEHGIKDLNIKPLDPLDLTGLSVPVAGMVDIKVLAGSVTGLKDCVINHASNDFDARLTQVDLACDLKVDTKIKLENISPVAQQLFGAEGDTGSGNLNLKIDKINIKLKLSYDFIKKDDGDVYIFMKNEHLKTEYEIENIHLEADKLIVGNKDISDFVVKLVNENWKTLVPTFGNGIVDVALDITKDIIGKFFDKVPTKYYSTDDITSYL